MKSFQIFFSSAGVTPSSHISFHMVQAAGEGLCNANRGLISVIRVSRMLTASEIKAEHTLYGVTKQACHPLNIFISVVQCSPSVVW